MWSPRIPTGYVPHGTWEQTRVDFGFTYTAVTLYGSRFHEIQLPPSNPILFAPQPPIAHSAKCSVLRKKCTGSFILSTFLFSLRTLCYAQQGLGFSAFAHRYLRNLCNFFSCPYLDVSVRGVPRSRLRAAPRCFHREGFPIRTPPDHSFLAAPRRLSWSSTSFFGSSIQGIHCLP